MLFSYEDVYLIYSYDTIPIELVRVSFKGFVPKLDVRTLVLVEVGRNIKSAMENRCLIRISIME